MQGYASAWFSLSPEASAPNQTENACWLISGNYEPPEPEVFYSCHCVGQDRNGVPIWATTNRNATRLASVSGIANAPPQTSTVTLSGGSTIQCYAAYLILINPANFVFGSLGSIWLWSNRPLPPIIAGVAPIYEAIYVGTDANGVEIWATALEWPDFGFIGATGADAIGNMFDNGICVQVGGGSSVGLVDGGSDW